MKKTLGGVLVTLLILLLAGLASAQTWTVERVIDGDTIKLDNGWTVRIYGIDAPEMKQEGGEQAKARLAGYLLDRPVSLNGITKDRYGRYVARVNWRSIDAGAAMIRNGYAWAYVDYLKEPFKTQYLGYQSAARLSGSGIWSGNPTPPWEYRRSRGIQPARIESPAPARTPVRVYRVLPPTYYFPQGGSS